MNSQTNKAWLTLFEQLKIAESLEKNGECSVTASEIKQITGREPRNMSKWDTRGSRPAVLSRAKVTVLPTSRHGYVLIRGDGYEDLPSPGPATYHSPRRLRDFTTLPWREELTKESAAIDVAAISLMLQKFTRESDLALTIRGRSGTPVFSFDFIGAERSHRVTVDRAQVEVDAGYEGEKIWLVEAKIGEPEDFLVRQLYYPWRQWSAQTKKEVVPVFLCYTNKTFGLFRYRFEQPENYHSVKLLEKAWFTLEESGEVKTQGELFESTRPAARPVGSVPFPQADTLGTVIAATELCAHETINASEVALALGFDERQGAYYTAAGRWLGLLGDRFNLTALGAKFLVATRGQRFEILFGAVSSTPVFREVIAAKLRGKELALDAITELIAKHGYASGSTARRRAQTVQCWIAWLWREFGNLRAQA